MMNRNRLWAPALVCSLSAAPFAGAEIFGGIDFPDGASSFADAVLTYDPSFGGGAVPTAPNFIDPAESIGSPNHDTGTGMGSVSLGAGGLLELAFLDNLLTNSGGTGDDLHIFEIGPQVEDTFVAIRPTAATLLLLDPSGDANLDGYFEVGSVTGATSSIDIDVFFPGFTAGQLQFNAVQLIDDISEGGTSGDTVGADIDAVGAITSIVPEPGSAALLALGGLAALRRRR